MELIIKLETYSNKTDYVPIGEAECRISIDESESYWSSDFVLRDIFRHLCQVLNDRVKATKAKDE